MHGPCAFGSHPPMSSRHRNLEPLGRWDATICLFVLNIKDTNEGKLLYLEPQVVALVISLPGNFS